VTPLDAAGHRRDRRAERRFRLAAAAISLNAPGVFQEPVEDRRPRRARLAVTFASTPRRLSAWVRPCRSCREYASCWRQGSGHGTARAPRGARRRRTGVRDTVPAASDRPGTPADAATELDAAMLLTWKGAAAGELSLAEASMAKLAATEPRNARSQERRRWWAQTRFRRGHIVERLAQDVRRWILLREGPRRSARRWHSRPCPRS
jgi:hypothetical protein